MFTFISLGTNGRLGNQLFQIASTIGFAKHFGHSEVAFSPWPYSEYFHCEGLRFEQNLYFTNSLILYERSVDWFSCLFEDFSFLEAASKSIQMDISGLYQCHKYFSFFELEIRDHVFRFKESFKATVYQKLPISPETCAIHVRRTDYLNCSETFYALPLRYYVLGMQKIINETGCQNFMVFSDDIEWCRQQEIFSECQFSEGLSDIEDLCAMAECDYHIIANSSFSWWGSYLAKSKRVIAPPIWVYYPYVPRERIMKSLFHGRPEVHVLEEHLDEIEAYSLMSWLPTEALLSL